MFANGPEVIFETFGVLLTDLVNALDDRILRHFLDLKKLKRCADNRRRVADGADDGLYSGPKRR